MPDSPEGHVARASPGAERTAPRAGAALPARSIDEIRLSEDVGSGACPICRTRQRTADRQLTALLSEGVNDVGIRARLERGRGFCASHTRQLVDTDRRRSGGTLGAAILLNAVLAQALDELSGLTGASGRVAGRRLAAARQPVDCFVCGHVDRSEALATTSLLGRCIDPAWAAALSIAPFCLAHLRSIWAVAARSPREVQDGWQPIAAAHVARLTEVAVALSAFIANSSHDRRSLLSDDQIDATRRAVFALAPADIPEDLPR